MCPNPTNCHPKISLSLSIYLLFEERVAWKERKEEKRRRKEKKKEEINVTKIFARVTRSNRPRVTASFPLRVLPKTTRSLFSALSTISLSLSFSLSFFLSPFVRTYDWTYQYADHETWSKPLSPRPSLRLSFLLVPSSPLSSLPRCPSPLSLSFPLARHPSRAHRSLFVAPSSALPLPSPSPLAPSSPKRNVGCFEESVSSVIPKRY